MERLNVTLATSVMGWNTTVNGQLVIELAKNPKVKVTGLVPSSTQAQKEQSKRLNIELVDAKKLTGFSPKERLSFPPDNLEIDILIIHSYGHDEGRQAQIIQETKKCKWLHVVHTNSEELEKYMDKKDEQGSEHQLQLALCQQADSVIAIGPKVADAFRSALRYCGKNKDVIDLTPGVIQELIDVRPPHQPGEPREVFRVLISATEFAKYYKVKGCDIAAKAISLLQEVPYYLICIVHNPPNDDAEDLNNRLLKEGIKQNQFKVRLFHSNTENWVKLLGEVDLIILPSRTEGFGTSSLRAISADLPVLISGNCGLGMALKKLPSGKKHVVESDDPEVWADEIRKVREKGAKDQALEARQLRHEYMEKFSWETQCHDLVERMVTMFPNKQDEVKKCVEHSEKIEQMKSPAPEAQRFETETVVYEEDVEFIKRGTQELGLAAAKNINKEKIGFDQVDSAGAPLERVNDNNNNSKNDLAKVTQQSINVADIPYSVCSKICLKLNIKDEMCFKDFRLLGEKMGFVNDVTRNLEQKTNPTNELLQMWSKKPGATVENLIALLKDDEMERWDVVAILEHWLKRMDSK